MSIRLPLSDILAYVRTHRSSPQRGLRERSEPHIIVDCIIAANGTWIKCLKCNRTSHNHNDVLAIYCGNCHEFKKYPRTETI